MKLGYDRVSIALGGVRSMDHQQQNYEDLTKHVG
jgi:hypothetical protein